MGIWSVALILQASSTQKRLECGNDQVFADILPGEGRMHGSLAGGRDADTPGIRLFARNGGPTRDYGPELRTERQLSGR